MTEQKETKLIYTHDGGFHADEVFACAILSLIYPNSHIERTRDKEVIEKAKLSDDIIVVDVGEELDWTKYNFDHHQPEYDGELASVGLIWKFFGRKLVDSDRLADNVYNSLIKYLDESDLGKISVSQDTIGLAEVISKFNRDMDNKSLQDRMFDKAILFAKSIIMNEIAHQSMLIAEDEIFKNGSTTHLAVGYNGSIHMAFMDFDKYCKIWKEKAIPEVKFAIMPRINNEWQIVARSRNMPIPEMIDNKLIFRHRNGYIATFKTKKDASEYLLTSLKQQNGKQGTK